IPFAGNRVRNVARRSYDDMPRRGADRPAIKHDRKTAVPLDHAGVLIKSLSRLRARAALCCLLWIERRLSRPFVEQFPHQYLLLPIERSTFVIDAMSSSLSRYARRIHGF